MTHILSDIVNPIGAITGIDPVKDATGFTGTGFESKPGASGGAQQASSSGGGGGGGGSGGGMLAAVSGQQFGLQQQQIAQQNSGFGQFGNQLNNIAQQMGPQAAQVQQPQAYQMALPAVASPSATQLAANITAQTVNSKIQDPMRQFKQGGM